MGTKAEGSASRRSGSALSPAVDAEQARLWKILARRAGEPVTYDELRDAGVEYPASLLSEMELAGIEIDRCQVPGPGGRPARAVRLPAAAEMPGLPPSASPQRAPVSQEAPRRASAPVWSAVRVYRNSLARSIGTAWATAFRRGDETRFAAQSPTFGSRSRPSLRLLAPLALLIASAVIVAVVLTATADQKGHPKLALHHHRPAATPADAAGARPHARADQARVKTPARARSASSMSVSASTALATPGSPSTTISTQQSAEATSSVAAPTAAASVKPAATETRPPVNSSAGNNLPGAAVEAFYEAAAHHRYVDAWALADSNMRNEVDGYAAFEEQMSTVRAITFHEISTLRQAPDSALVAVRTTSEQTNRVQQCSGTVRTVYPAGAWLLDGISIHCT